MHLLKLGNIIHCNISKFFRSSNYYNSMCKLCVIDKGIITNSY